MSVLQTSRSPEVSPKDYTTDRPWWRSLVLAAALGGSLAIYARLIQVSPHVPTVVDGNTQVLDSSLAQVYLLGFLPYLVASLVILLSKPVSGRWRWVELGLILGGALVVRGILLPLPPNLSRDSWRYVWDARVFLHGYSPYVYAPADPRLKSMWDAIYAYSRFRNVPSLYPPGAQYIFTLSYLLVPSNLFFLKGVFVCFDLTSCVLLAVLLARKGLDPARAILYAWCPLPVVEFALQGHVDVLAITFTLLAAFAAHSHTRRGRALTGFLVGMGTLAKLYPILMLVPLVRLREWKRDGWLIGTCLLTIVVGYLPFYIQGHGQIFGFFGAYANEQGQNAGMVQQLIAWFGRQGHWSLSTVILREHIVAFLLMAGAALAVFLLRQRERISVEAGTLVLFGLVLSVSSHVFPWYTTTLLPWLLLLWPARHQLRFSPAILARLLAVNATWFFVCICVTSYIVVDWSVYYHAVYDPLATELALASLIALCFSSDFWLKGVIRARRFSRKRF